MIEVSNRCDLESQLKRCKRVLALFYASWCPYCRSFLPVFNKNSSKQSVDLAVRVKVDDYDNPLWEEYSIEAVPTVILFEAENICKRLDGRFGYGLSEKQLEEWLEDETC
jgi:thioredoxin 1